MVFIIIAKTKADQVHLMVVVANFINDVFTLLFLEISRTFQKLFFEIVSLSVSKLSAH